MEEYEISETTRRQAYDYAHGFNGLAHDGARAMRLYRRAVAMGNRRAMGELAYFYLNGIFVDQDVTEAVRLYEEAVKTEVCDSWLYALAACYEKGDGVPRSLARSLSLYRRAAELGSARARKALWRLGEAVPERASAG